MDIKRDTWQSDWRCTWFGDNLCKEKKGHLDLVSKTGNVGFHCLSSYALSLYDCVCLWAKILQCANEWIHVPHQYHEIQLLHFKQNYIFHYSYFFFNLWLIEFGFAIVNFFLFIHPHIDINYISFVGTFIVFVNSDGYFNCKGSPGSFISLYLHA